MLISLAIFSCNSQKQETQVQTTELIQSAESLNNKLAKGWNTWNTRSVLSHVLLPQNFTVDLQLQDQKSNQILEEALIGRRGEGVESVIPGPHTYDGAYTELTVSWKELQLNVKTAATDNDLSILINPDEVKRAGNLIIKPRLIWGKTGEIKITKDGFSFENDNATIHFYLKSTNDVVLNDSMLIIPLKDKIILSTYKDKSEEELVQLIKNAGEKLAANKTAFGENSELYNAMQSVLAWDVIYEPSLQKVISPVSRVWNAGDTWKGWVLFDWDTYFAAYMYSLDNKELAYANAIAITKEISQQGFIPNFASSIGKSEDRSQPPVGSFVIWNIYKKYQEKWFLEEVFDELITWNRWWEKDRDVDGYLCWGSNPCDSTGMAKWLYDEVNKKQAGMWESGLDNSPMYDEAVFDTVSHKLLMADAGLMGMYVWDCKNLSFIAEALGKGKIKNELLARAEKYSKKLATLYNKDFGMYLNKDLVTGEFSYRLSPTLFYPLLAETPTQKQAERIIQDHFYNPEEFWGEWIMPSIARNDPAFEDNEYWRGRIWAPLNFLVYNGIKNYNLPNAKNDLVEKSKNLMLKSWLTERHIYENYNAETGIGDDVLASDKFYHWGALLAFMTLLEEDSN